MELNILCDSLDSLPLSLALALAEGGGGCPPTAKPPQHRRVTCYVVK